MALTERELMIIRDLEREWRAESQPPRRRLPHHVVLFAAIGMLGVAAFCTLLYAIATGRPNTSDLSVAGLMGLAVGIATACWLQWSGVLRRRPKSPS